MDEVRLIDANALKKALKSNCKPELCHDYNTAWCESCCQTNDFEDLIDEAPTINPEKKLQTPSCLTNPERQAELLERYKEE